MHCGDHHNGFSHVKRKDSPAQKRKPHMGAPSALPKVSFTERYSAILLVSILLLAAILRLIARSNWGDSPYSDFLLWDERIDDAWAQKAARGAISPFPVAEFAALPAYLMFFVYKTSRPTPFSSGS
jgi:hypothetical protein